MILKVTMGMMMMNAKRMRMTIVKRKNMKKRNTKIRKKHQCQRKNKNVRKKRVSPHTETIMTMKTSENEESRPEYNLKRWKRPMNTWRHTTME